jgi:antirestriction protein ArdC
MAATKTNFSNRLREEITNSIIKSLKDNHIPWRQPWRAMGGPAAKGLPTNFLSKKAYRGINILILNTMADEHKFRSKYWGTHKQWSEFGAYVKPHPAHIAPKDWGSRIVFNTVLEKKNKDEDGKLAKKPTAKTITAPRGKKEDEEEKMDKFFFLRSFTVYNVEQVAPPDVAYLVAKPKSLESYIKRFGSKGKTPEQQAQHIHDVVKERLQPFLVKDVKPKKVTKATFKPAEDFVEAVNADIRYGGDRAFYRPKPGDYIQMPHREQFENLGAFYETLFHEITHWGNTPHRANLQQKQGSKNTEYAFEELVAEMTAAFLAQHLGIPFAEELLPNNQRYLKHWLSRMGDDPKFIFQASNIAHKMADYLLAFSEPQTVA